MVHPLRMARLQRQSQETVSMPNVQIGVSAIQPMVSARVLHGMVRRQIYGRLQTVPVDLLLKQLEIVRIADLLVAQSVNVHPQILPRCAVGMVPVRVPVLGCARVMLGTRAPIVRCVPVLFHRRGSMKPLILIQHMLRLNVLIVVYVIVRLERVRVIRF